jgi:hypothetical protein
MTKPDSEFGQQPFEEKEPNLNGSSTVTGLFSRSAITPAGQAAKDDEVLRLLQTPVAGESGSSVAQSASQPVESKQLSAANQNKANSDPSAGAPDLTGIFRKVQFDRSGAGSQRENEQNFAPEPRTSPSAENRPNDADQGFTQMFQSLSMGDSASAGTASSGSQKRGNENVHDPEPLPAMKWKNGPQAEEYRQFSESTSQTAEGEFTRLFQRLDREEVSTQPVLGRVDERMDPAMSKPQFSGGFTQLLRTLSAEEQEVPTSQVIPPPAPVQASSGPGEFTRIISGSMLREAQGRTDVPASLQPHSPQENPNVPPPAAGGSFPAAMPMPAAAPMAMGMPQPFAPPPPVPPMQMPMPMAAPPMPIPPMAAPPVATPVQAPMMTEAPAGKLGRYLPLLLISNFFLMMLVLILVVFLLLHRK